MRLRYLTPLTYPSRLANRVQVMKMSAALSKQADFALYIENTKVPSEELFHDYSIHAPFTIKEVGQPSLWPRSFWLAWKYRALINVSEKDVVWYVRDVLLTFWLIVLSRKFRNSYIFELHTLSRFPNFVYRRVLSNAACTITTNERKKKDIQSQYGIPADSILVAGNGIDLEEFSLLPSREEARRILAITTTKPLLVYTGTDEKNYGTGILREAAKILSGQTEMLIITGKPRREALMYMRAADVLVAPYLGENEHMRLYMSPMKVKEYMAEAKPIIVSDLPAVRDVGLTEKQVFFTEPGSAKALAESIQFVLTHPEEAEKRSREVRMLANQFTWDNRAERIINFISSKTNANRA